jgi:hypothetical protein
VRIGEVSGTGSAGAWCSRGGEADSEGGDGGSRLILGRGRLRRLDCGSEVKVRFRFLELQNRQEGGAERQNVFQSEVVMSTRFTCLDVVQRRDERC